MTRVFKKPGWSAGRNAGSPGPVTLPSGGSRGFTGNEPSGQHLEGQTRDESTQVKGQAERQVTGAEPSCRTGCQTWLGRDTRTD